MQLFVEFMVRFCCVPRDRLIRYVYRAFDTSGIGQLTLTGACTVDADCGAARGYFAAGCAEPVSRSFLSSVSLLPCAADMGRMVKALHPNYGRGPFEKMMEVCLTTCKMTKSDSKKTCSMDEVRWSGPQDHSPQDITVLGASVSFACYFCILFGLWFCLYDIASGAAATVCVGVLVVELVVHGHVWWSSLLHSSCCYLGRRRRCFTR